MKTSILACALAASALLSGCSTEHSRATGWLDLQREPDPGYVWKNPNSLLSYEVVWVAGSTSPLFAHAVADTLENHWVAEAGYEFTDASDPASVRWKPGVKFSNYPHAVTAPQEGQWLPEAGYLLSSPDRPDIVMWNPGSQNKDYPHIHAASTEGKWVPDQGYSWVDTDPNNLAVTPVSLEASQAENEPDLGRIIVHTLATSCAQPQPDDGVGATIGRVGCALVAVGTGD